MNFYEFFLGLIIACVVLFLGVGIIGSRYDTEKLKKDIIKLKEENKKLRERKMKKLGGKTNEK